MHYKPVNLYVGIKKMDRDVALDNLKVLARVFCDAGLRITPAYGTLLGIIRDNNFIEWDEDIDLFILREDKEKFLSVLWDLKDECFKLVREDRCGFLYSVMRHGEYIDFYIMDSVSPELRTTYGGFVFEKYLTDLVNYNFRGITISVPRESEQCLEFMYGDWRTPIKYANYEMSNISIFIAQLKNKLKMFLPLPVRFRLLKAYHRKDLKKFLAKCEKKGVKLNFPIRF